MIEEYIERRKNTVMKYAWERSIYQRCMNSHPIANSTHQVVWWDCSPNYLADGAQMPNEMGGRNPSGFHMNNNNKLANLKIDSTYM